MARYIDADKLIERINASCAFPNVGQDGCFLRDCVIDLIGKQTTADVVEVVRGKDCKYLMFSDCYGECKRYLRLVNMTDFCSSGERRTDGDKGDG